MSQTPPPPNLPGMPEKKEVEEKESKNETSMNNEKQPMKKEVRDFLIIIAVFVLLVAAYFFVSIVFPGDEVSGGGVEAVATDVEKPSPFLGEITLGSGTAGSAIYPSREYITITVERKGSSYLPLSNWSVRNAEGERFKLGRASYVPLRGEVNEENKIVIVGAGQTLVVSSGASPIGVSFQQNVCSGYLEQFQNFYPAIPQTCPDISKLTEDASEVCQAYIEEVPKCTAVIQPLPDYLSGTCKHFIHTKMSYNGCVETYRHAPRFSGSIWRVYLRQESQIWAGEDGTITLLDGKGRIVDKVSY